ncbi:hypothetical protein NGK67_27215, partial [Klebsiella oxytoca]|uniref:hypothetical protein n=1 Tax=Klebsiella oxytoca TaxID=571 RepID=UPI002DBDC2C1
ERCRGEASAWLFPGGAALTGLRVHSNLRTGSPDKARQRRLRERCRGEASAWLFPGGAALTGLRVHSNLRTGSPDKARQ